MKYPISQLIQPGISFLNIRPPIEIRRNIRHYALGIWVVVEVIKDISIIEISSALGKFNVPGQEFLLYYKQGTAYGFIKMHTTNKQDNYQNIWTKKGVRFYSQESR